MATTTMELRTFLDFGYKLFDFPYQFDDDVFKEEIEQAVLEYFYFHEIGQETPEKFKFIFRSKWKRTLEYYNKLYNTSLLEYNPLINYKVSEALDQLRQTTDKQDTTGNTTGTGGTTTDHSDNSNSTREEQRKEDVLGTSKGTDKGTVSKSGTENTNSNTAGTEENTTTDNRTDNLKNTTNSDEKTSDYPQQSIGTGDYLSGGKNTQQDSTNTGTVENDGTSSTTTNTTGESAIDTTEENEHSTNTTNDTTEKTTGTITEDNTGTTQGQEETQTTSQEDRQEHRQGTGRDKTDYQKTIEGLTGKTYQELIQLERENIIRIKDMVIQEMKTCFLLVY